MFMELGRKLDNSLVHLKEWNTQRMWYKPYAHFYIKKQIKVNIFTDEEHFKYFMDIVVDNKQIYKWQYKQLYEIYKKSKGCGK